MFSRIIRLVGSASARKLPVRKAACEVLEQRQLLAARAFGEIGGGFRTELLTPGRGGDYTFSVSGAVQVNAWLGVGTAAVLNADGKSVASGRRLSAVLGTGSYTLQTSAPADTVLQIGTKRVPAIAPGRLQADVWGGSAIHLTWLDNADTEVQYRVDRWTKKGWRRSVRVGANATAAVINNLPLGSRTTYRVSAVSANGGSVQSTNTVLAQTLTEDTTGWYKVDLTAASTGETSQTLVKDTLKVWPQYQDGAAGKSKWVHASSWQMAAWTVVGGYKTAGESTTVDPVVTNDGNKDAQQYFPNGYFKIGTAGEFRGSITKENNSNGFEVAGDDAQKMIVLEDSYEAFDRDYDDFYWIIDTSYVKKLANLTAYMPKDPGDSLTIAETFTREERKISEENEAVPGYGAFVRPDKFGSSESLIDINLTEVQDLDENEQKLVLRRYASYVTVQKTMTGEAVFHADKLDKDIFSTADQHFHAGLTNDQFGILQVVLVDVDTNNEQIVDEIDLRPFQSMVFGYVGETFTFTSPYANGMFDVARKLYKAGYNVGLYNPSFPVQAQSAMATAAYFTSQNYIKSYGVYGHSHGGGEVYKLAQSMPGNQNLDITVYVDAVRHQGTTDWNSETRLPPGTAFHANYYQTAPYQPVYGVSIPGSNVDLDVRTTAWGANLNHTSIDNDSTTIAIVDGLLRSKLIR
jgi:hypothetical protein